MTKRFKADTKTEEIDKVKKQNRELKRQLRAARKELKMTNDRLDTLSELLEEAEANIVVVPVKETEQCPKCNSKVNEIPAGKFIVLKCSNCTWRKRV